LRVTPVTSVKDPVTSPHEAFKAWPWAFTRLKCIVHEVNMTSRDLK
jgi:hypothetical protein